MKRKHVAEEGLGLAGNEQPRFLLDVMILGVKLRRVDLEDPLRISRWD
jgi:hypothetical protein